ncbi:hypothetical protein GCM10010967_50170 [Dyadobacter beijingensis]|uniref:Lipocalin-like domain-containing protein n=1 Tax=Dyadobacter beijingensis TaxID=365489 RepID=A0ABQ2IE58_9BACT|nr:hypothetical protein [Dyadobacter beijingensis]GGN08475.1 hypothetical protein GCM10010967_50170 [Dyadobacter beijingensis]
MKKVISAAALGLFFLSTAFECGREVDCCVPPPCTENASLDGTWKLEQFQNISTGTSDPDPNVEGKSVIYTFDDDQREGSITGHTFVNTVMGSYTLGAGCTIKVNGFGGSKVGEPEWSRKAWFPSDSAALGNYSVVKDKLVIRFGQSPEQLVFKKQK